MATPSRYAPPKGQKVIFRRRYGRDGVDGDVITWRESVCRWSAVRRDGLWWLQRPGGQRVQSCTWWELCLRLMCHGVQSVTRPAPGTVEVGPPVQVAPLPPKGAVRYLPTGPGGFFGDTLVGFTPVGAR